MDEATWDEANRLTLGDLCVMLVVTLGAVAFVVVLLLSDPPRPSISCQTPVSTTGFPVDPQCVPQGLR